MALIPSQMTITWYPGVPGDLDDPLVLLDDSGDYVEEGSLPAVFQSQADQPTDFLRAASRGNFARGNYATTFSFETVRRESDLMTSMEMALAAAAGLPGVVGWVRIQLGGKAAEWQIPEVVLNDVGGTPVPREGMLYFPWKITGGKLATYAGGGDPPAIYTPGEILETGPGPSDRGAVLLTVAD